MIVKTGCGTDGALHSTTSDWLQGGGGGQVRGHAGGAGRAEAGAQVGEGGHF